jgi:hypothetical protein
MDIGWGDKYVMTQKSVDCSQDCYMQKKTKTFKQNEAVKFSNQLCFGKSVINLSVSMFLNWRVLVNICLLFLDQLQLLAVRKLDAKHWHISEG